ncbi:AraC family transcriptional regulator [Desulfopila aestuarii]|uniref:AraC-type DNA-binding protein n=1 Tax=Desulfopila aestuarii DSM 18488 TaxID=1121416 RepID=A0A1M7Y574_9BACT|nr:AraC family transcriptional regulator [Desulfopila aestuarii]SHO47495.1 AraC-type DNA-binding protein [Desulfopila aestuarii DSM 18488]
MHLTKLASIQLVNWNILEEYNLDPFTIFTKVQLDPTLMHHPGARYPLSRIADLWEEMEKVIKDPCFGLLAAKRWHPANFGTLGYALLMSTSLRTTLERLIRFHRVISDARFASLYEETAKSALVFDLSNPDEAPYTAAREDAALAWIMSVLKVNFQRPLSPISVSFTHSRPEECAGKYYELFQAPIHFDAPAARIELSLNDADRILPSGNKEMLDLKEEVMTGYLEARSEKSLVARVTKCIVEHLPSGDATVEKIASELFVSTRKLQRLLQEEGTSFLTLLNSTRQSIAEQYVQNKNMDLTEIAFLLGFSDQSTFSRSFKRWTGRSPRAFRSAN